MDAGFWYHCEMSLALFAGWLAFVLTMYGMNREWERAWEEWRRRVGRRIP